MQTISGIRLLSQQLVNTNFQTPHKIVSWMGAMQAQDFNMAKWAIGIRLPGSSAKTIEESFDKGDILRTHVLRPTWHFVAKEDIRWMVELTAPRIKMASKSRDAHLNLDEGSYSRSNDVIRKALEGNKHLTREELTVAFEQAKLPADTFQVVHYMMRAEIDGIVCSGSMRGKMQTYALMDERVPEKQSFYKEEALGKLANTYFKSHCPATLQDFVWWSGLSATDARKGLEMIKSGLIMEKVNSQEYWFSDAFAGLPEHSETVHLLPAFDEYIISYKDRSSILPLDHHSKAISSNGIFRPVILRDGQAIGIWKKSATKSKVIVPDFFNKPVDFTEAHLEKPTASFAHFWGVKI